MAHAPKDKPPLPLVPMLFHAALAAGIFFCINRFALAQSFDTALMWAVIAAPFAAYLAYKQAGR
jgi:hypothetical protein